MVFWCFIKRVDHGLLPSERGLILQEKDVHFHVIEAHNKRGANKAQIKPSKETETVSGIFLNDFTKQ